jgi:hypothetical protein
VSRFGYPRRSEDQPGPCSVAAGNRIDLDLDQPFRFHGPVDRQKRAHRPDVPEIGFPRLDGLFPIFDIGQDDARSFDVMMPGARLLQGGLDDLETLRGLGEDVADPHGLAVGAVPPTEMNGPTRTGPARLKPTIFSNGSPPEIRWR